MKTRGRGAKAGGHSRDAFDAGRQEYFFISISYETARSPGSALHRLSWQSSQ